MNIQALHFVLDIDGNGSVAGWEIIDALKWGFSLPGRLMVEGLGNIPFIAQAFGIQASAATGYASFHSLLATALNLLPVGQLDGGHIVYCLFPRRHLWLSRFFVVLVLLPLGFVWEGWWFWAAVLFIFRLRHPAVYDNAQLGPGRKLVAFTALVIFLLCFTISPVV